MKYLKLFEDFKKPTYNSYQTKLMDYLLDKGLDNLTPEERDMLNNIDKHKEPVVKPLDDTHIKNREDWENAMGDFINRKKQNVTYTDSSDRITFKLVETSESEEHDIYQGEIHFEGVKYFGYIFKDKATEEPTYKFQSLDGEEFEPADHDLHYEFDDLLQQVLYDENITK